MYTNTTRLTGLSGIDTETLIKQLMTAESVGYNRLKASSQTLTWKQDAFRGVAANLQTFQNTFLSFTNAATNMRSTATFGGFSTDVRVAGAESNAVTVKTTGSSKAGDYSLKVLQLAAKETYRSSSNLGGSINTTLTDASNIIAGDSFHINLDGVSRRMEFDENDIANIGGSMENLQNILQSKIDSVFGKEAAVGGGTQSKIVVSTQGGTLSLIPGKGHEVKITDAFGRNTAQISNNDITNLTSGVKLLTVTIGGTSKIIEIDVNETEDLEDKSKLVQKINNALKKEGLSGSVYAALDGDKVKFTAVNTTSDIIIEDSEGNNFLNELGFNNTSITISHTSSLTTLGIANGTTNKLDLSKSLGTFFGDAISDENGSFLLNGSTIRYNKATTLGELINSINASGAGVNLSYSNLSREFTLESTVGGIPGELSGMPEELKLMFGFKASSEYTQAEIDSGRFKAATDALVELNGVLTSRTTNNFEIDGIGFQLNEVSDEEIKISVKKDTTKGIEVIKKFVEAYNELIDNMNTQMRTQRPKNGRYSYYGPLTDEEKEAMSDRQIELWESKAKEGLLYNDPIISDIASKMRTSFYDTVMLSDGSKMGLFDLGITTSDDYRQAGKLIIDETKLDQVLSEKGELVAELFTKSSTIPYSNNSNKTARLAEEGLSERINDIINDTIAANGTITNYAGIKGTFSEGQNAIYKQLEAQATRLSEMLEALTKKETNYYSMFSKMEAAMNNSNTQMAYLTAQFGG